MGKLCLRTSLEEIYVENWVQTSRKAKSYNKVFSCTIRFKTGVFNYFKINSMSNDEHSLRSFTSRPVLSELVPDSRPCFYSVPEYVIKQNGIDKIIMDPLAF